MTCRLLKKNPPWHEKRRNRVREIQRPLTDFMRMKFSGIFCTVGGQPVESFNRPSQTVACRVLAGALLDIIYSVVTTDATTPESPEFPEIGMNRRSREFFRILFGMLLAFVSIDTRVVYAESLSSDEIVKTAIDAYIYGYPLVSMEMTRRVMTNAITPDELRGPMGQFIHLRGYPSATFRDITTPNADTLYSSAWINLAKEPQILSIPDADQRYLLMPMLSGWTDVFASPGLRTTGTAAQKFAITGPSWKGTLPEGVTECKSPTNLVWIFGRTYCTGTDEDYRIVHTLQDKYSIVPLSAFGKPYVPPTGTIDPSVDMKTPVRDQVNGMDIATFFNWMARLMIDNPPTEDDASIMARMAKMGIVPGKKFDLNQFAPAAIEAIRSVPQMAQSIIAAKALNAGRVVNGWIYVQKAGSYGADYLQRAFIAAVGFGANLPEDAVYPTSLFDSEGRSYDGAHKYLLHFPSGQTPPAKAFWSLTMYDSNMFFVENKLNRFTLSSRFDFQYNADGSLDLYIQKDSPGEELESNWLPAPPGNFVLMLRLYWPQTTPPSIIDGTWKPPAVRKLK